METGSILLRVGIVAIEILLIVLPLYLYRKYRKKDYLIWAFSVLGVLVVSACIVLLLIIGATGMID
jgi:hypothetical protein